MREAVLGDGVPVRDAVAQPQRQRGVHSDGALVGGWDHQQGDAIDAMLGQPLADLNDPRERSLLDVVHRDRERRAAFRGDHRSASSRFRSASSDAIAASQP